VKVRLEKKKRNKEDELCRKKKRMFSIT